MKMVQDRVTSVSLAALFHTVPCNRQAAAVISMSSPYEITMIAFDYPG